MTETALIVFCWIALAVTALVFFGTASVGAAYHPDQGARYLATAAAPLIVIGGLLGLLPRTDGLVWLVLLMATALAGVALVGTFACRLAVDGADAMLWTPPMLLGVGLLALVLGLGRTAGKRGGA